MLMVVYGVVLDFNIFVWFDVGVNVDGEWKFINYFNDLVCFNDFIVVLFVDR